MSSGRALSLAFVGLMSLWPLQTQSDAQEKPTVQLPQPGVPQIITMEGKFVRASYNREGYVILGYQASNRSIGLEPECRVLAQITVGKVRRLVLKSPTAAL